MSFRKMAGVCGLAVVVLMAASFVLYGSPPSATAPADEIVAYIEDTDTYLLSGIAGALGAVLMVPFAVGFTLPVLASDREHREGFGAVVLATFAVATGCVGLAIAALAVTGLRVDELGPAVVRGLWDFSNTIYAFSILLLIPAGAAMAMAITRHGLMPRWFGYLSWVVALLGLTGIPGFLVATNAAMAVIAGFAAMLVWILSASILMVREPTT